MHPTVQPPRERQPSEQHRELLRTQREPRWYSPVAHLAATTLCGLGVTVAALAGLREPGPGTLAAAAATLLLANAIEWHVHRGMLHRRRRLAPVLYDRHTPVHHMVFLTDDMAVRSRREWRLVLIPARGMALAFGGVAGAAALLHVAGAPDAARAYAAAAALYLVSYEWLHLAWHLPAGSRVGSLRLVQALARHHAVHHDPRLMQRWNFNVAVPLWDLVRGTRARSYAEARSRESGSAARRRAETVRRAPLDGSAAARREA